MRTDWAGGMLLKSQPDLLDGAWARTIWQRVEVFSAAEIHKLLKDREVHKSFKTQPWI